jgi:integrase
VDGAGFEPAASTMPTRLHLGSDCLEKFADFLLVNMRLEKKTIQQNIQDARRFLRMSDYIVNYDNVRSYLESYIPKAAKTYNTQITSLRRFIRDFLQVPKFIMSFKMAPVDEWAFAKELPSKSQIRLGFEGLEETMAKAIYLFTATTGLRKGEILALQKSQVDFNLRSVIPKHFTRKKRSGITFFNDEMAVWLQKYLMKRKDDFQKLFVVSDRQWKKIWRLASKSAGVSITSKVLRAWFSTEMGELGVADRFIDVFQGRAPRSVLAKHYTGTGLERLKRIYDKANFRIST